MVPAVCECSYLFFTHQTFGYEKKCRLKMLPGNWSRGHWWCSDKTSFVQMNTSRCSSLAVSGTFPLLLCITQSAHGYISLTGQPKAFGQERMRTSHHLWMHMCVSMHAVCVCARVCARACVCMLSAPVLGKRNGSLQQPDQSSRR